MTIEALLPPAFEEVSIVSGNAVPGVRDLMVERSYFRGSIDSDGCGWLVEGVSHAGLAESGSLVLMTAGTRFRVRVA